MLTTIRHWLPLLTICPINNLPDLVYVSVSFESEFRELYSVRKQIKKAVNFRRCYMEQIAESIAQQFPSAIEIRVSLLFNRHTVIIRRSK